VEVFQNKIDLLGDGRSTAETCCTEKKLYVDLCVCVLMVTFVDFSEIICFLACLKCK